MKLASFRYHNRDRTGFAVDGLLVDLAVAKSGGAAQVTGLSVLENPVRRLPE